MDKLKQELTERVIALLTPVPAEANKGLVYEPFADLGQVEVQKMSALQVTVLIKPKEGGFRRVFLVKVSEVL